MNLSSRLRRLESHRLPPARPTRQPTVADLQAGLAELAGYLDDGVLLDDLNRVRSRLQVDAGRATMREIRQVCTAILKE